MQPSKSFRALIACSTLAFVFFFRVSHALAATITLFGALGAPVAGYDIELGRVRVGDTLKLGLGREVTVFGKLARTMNTEVLDIGDGLALRLPASRYKRRVGSILLGGGMHDPMRLVNATLDGYEDFVGWNLPVAKLHPELSRAGAYTVVEKLDIRFSLASYLASRETALDDELVEFAARFWMFQSIGDARPDQVVYTDRGWVLLDWTHQHRRIYRNSLDRNVFEVPGEGHLAFTEYFGTNAAIHARLSKRISERVLEERKKHRAELSFSCKLLLLNPVLKKLDGSI